MSIVTMDMTSYEVQQDGSCQQGFKSNEYSDEVLCSGWVPALALQQAPDFENRASIPEDMVDMDAERFLHKMYVWLR